MAPAENSNEEKELEEVKNKLENLSSIMEKFGLDVISKLGQVTFNLKILTDKVDKLSDATIDIKSLSPQLTKVIENQDYLESEIDLLKSLIQKINKPKVANTSKDTTTESNSIITGKKITITEDLKNLKNLVNEEAEIDILIQELKNLKESIFEFTGGSRLSYDISQIIKQLEKKDGISASLKTTILEKISYLKENL